MLIICPSCDANYNVPDARLRQGKMVRCSQCGSEWLPLEQAHELTDEFNALESDDGHIEEHVGPMPRLGAIHRLAAAVQLLPQRTGLIAAWVATCMVLIAGMATTLTRREAVVRAWPPSSRLLGNVEPEAKLSVRHVARAVE